MKATSLSTNCSLPLLILEVPNMWKYSINSLRFSIRLPDKNLGDSIFHPYTQVEALVLVLIQIYSPYHYALNVIYLLLFRFLRVGSTRTEYSNHPIFHKLALTFHSQKSSLRLMPPFHKPAIESPVPLNLISIISIYYLQKSRSFQLNSGLRSSLATCIINAVQSQFSSHPTNHPDWYFILIYICNNLIVVTIILTIIIAITSNTIIYRPIYSSNCSTIVGLDWWIVGPTKGELHRSDHPCQLYNALLIKSNTWSFYVYNNRCSGLRILKGQFPITSYIHTIFSESRVENTHILSYIICSSVTGN